MSRIGYIVYVGCYAAQCGTVQEDFSFVVIMAWGAPCLVTPSIDAIHCQLLQRTTKRYRLQSLLCLAPTEFVVIFLFLGGMRQLDCEYVCTR